MIQKLDKFPSLKPRIINCTIKPFKNTPSTHHSGWHAIRKYILNCQSKGRNFNIVLQFKSWRREDSLQINKGLPPHNEETEDLTLRQNALSCTEGKKLIHEHQNHTRQKLERGEWSSKRNMSHILNHLQHTLYINNFSVILKQHTKKITFSLRKIIGNIYKHWGRALREII